MNLLTDAPPRSVEIHGKEVPINTDFRTWLRIVNASSDGGLTPQEKAVVFLLNAYPAQPDDAEAAIQAAGWFMNGGRDDYESDNSPRAVSFEKDAPLIYAAFRQTHGIDLTTADLHWWQFLALMQGLDSDSNFRQLVNLRMRVASGRATKEERQAARELGDLFEVEDVDDRSLEEKDAEAKAEAKFWALVEEGERRRAMRKK